MRKLIFLSHIHEEAELAAIIKQAIEQEFNGLAEVFVSSDGKCIPAGVNFLTLIEDALVNCAAGLYLMSKESVKREWINFELACVWMRRLLNKKKGIDIPTIPMCHSGMRPDQLPMPIINLNGIELNNAKNIEFVFRSLNAVVGKKDSLNTDFEAVAKQVQEFEKLHSPSKNGQICIQEIHHTNLTVKDLKASVPFYVNFLHLKPAPRPGRDVFPFDGAWFGLPNGQQIHLVENPNSTFRNKPLFKRGEVPDVHFALKVTAEEYLAVYGEAIRRGIPCLFEPFSGLQQLYVQDEDGHIIEITTGLSN